MQQPYPQDEPMAKASTPLRAKPGQRVATSTKKPLPESSPLKQRPKTARQVKQDKEQAAKDLANSKPSDKFAFEDKDAEIEHLRRQLDIYAQKDAVREDLQSQNGTLQAQLDASYRTNEQQLLVNEQQAALIFAQTQQIQSMQEEKGLLAEQVVELEGLRTQHQEQMTASVQYMEDLEKRVYETNQVSLELLTQLRDQTEEIETLKIYCIDLKAKVAVYIPIKEDPVDCKLADFVNNYPDRNKIKIMFLREASGVYEFGTKRVEVRVAKNKIVVRTGGGYMGIDEFLDQYTTIELEKLERRDPLKKFAERIALAKTMEGRDVSPMSVTSKRL